VLCGLLCVGVQASAGTADTPTKKAASSSPAQPTSVKHSKRKHSTGKHSSSHARGKSAKGKKKRGQQVIESPRAREIQGALIAQHYMEGKPSGMWDAATQDAMKRYQAAQGWQSKTVPDSRALIKLGLGPSKDGLLNPESAMTAGALANDAKAGARTTGDPANSSNIPGQDKPQ
jgi:hypothetical protein